MNGRSGALSLSRRREDIRAWWREHIHRQRSSGQSQAAYCRSQGLEPKYFSLWRAKLAKAAAMEAPRDKQVIPVAKLVPVIVKGVSAPVMPPTNGDVLIALTLPNGLGLSLRVSSMAALPLLLSELAGVRC